MKEISAEDINNFEKVYRLNLINSITGFKSANLIGTKSLESGISNLAIFSSVIHLGSNPPLLGFMLRPTSGDNNTFENLKESGFFTVNHVPKTQLKSAHQTSAKYDPKISEFDKTGLTEIYKADFQAPYVEESRIQLACRYRNDYFIEENDCRLIVGEIEQVFLPDNALEEDGFVDLQKAGSVTINGVDGYSETGLIDRFSYAKPD
jgi:flavin reductase (DIM6/NTAB) family NADH-FMN oxidoreductase RutF